MSSPSSPSLPSHTSQNPMHELSLVTELVSECVQRAGGRRVAAVHVRCPDGVDAGELADAFSQLTAGGVLAGAALEIETVPQVLTCGCGFSGEVDPEQCAGHMVICPSCSLVHEAPDALELIAVRFPDDSRDAAPASDSAPPSRGAG